jgi:pimeloyl-ACP methyl ester carboxylesterase
MTYFTRTAQGTLAFDDSGGAGPLIVLAPSLGDLRQEYRFLAPLLVAQGWRVVTMDLRGLGESSTGWPEHTPEAVGRDFLELTRGLGAGPAVQAGCSLAAASAIWSAVEEPDLVAGIILLGPSTRDVPATALQSAMMSAGLAGPWKVRAWDFFYASLYKKTPPDDLADYRRRLRANLAEPGRFDAVKQYVAASKAGSERRIASVTQPSLVIMGELDPDFADPAAEARQLGERLRGEVVVVPNSGHYPQAETPAVVALEIQRWSTAHSLLTPLAKSD